MFRNVKASSPWLNIILLVGAIVRLPTPLSYGLVISANEYDGLRGRDLTPLCHVRNVVTILLLFMSFKFLLAYIFTFPMSMHIAGVCVGVLCWWSTGYLSTSTKELADIQNISKSKAQV